MTVGKAVPLSCMLQGTWEQKTDQDTVNSVFSLLVSTGKISLQEPQVPDTSWKIWNQKDLGWWRRIGLGNS